MLLDAMSNAFGSIMLIAVLLVVSTSDCTKKIVQKLADAQIAAIESAQLESLTKEIDALRAEIAALEKTPATDSAAKLAELQKKEAELSAKLDEILKKVSQRFVSAEAPDVPAARELQKTAEQNGKLEAEVAALTREKMELEKKLAKVKAAAVVADVSPPMISKSNLGFRWVIIRNGVLFPYIPSSKTVVKVGDKTYLVPDYDFGLEVGNGEFEKYLDGIPEKCFVSFMVAPDEFSNRALRAAIEILRKRGIGYFWAPTINFYMETFGTKGWSPDGTY